MKNSFSQAVIVSSRNHSLSDFHKTYYKVKKVLHSCKTLDQVNVAKNMIMIFSRRCCSDKQILLRNYLISLLHEKKCFLKSNIK